MSAVEKSTSSELLVVIAIIGGFFRGSKVKTKKEFREFKKFKENENISKNNKSNIRVGKWNGKEIKLFSTGTTLSDLKKT